MQEALTQRRIHGLEPGRRALRVENYRYRKVEQNQKKVRKSTLYFKNNFKIAMFHGIIINCKLGYDTTYES